MSIIPFTMILPSKMKYVGPVSAAISEIAADAGFDEKDVWAIRLGAEEAISNVITHSFHKIENETFEVSCETDSLEFRISIIEKGIPFFPDEEQSYVPPSTINDADGIPESGLGLFLMKKFMDKVSFINLGKEGNKTVPIKERKGSIDDRSDSEVLDPDDDAKQAPDRQKEKVSFTVHPLLESNQAKQITKNAFFTYGYSYRDYFYHPDQILQMNRDGKIYSAIAISDDDTVVGHMNLDFNVSDTRLAELTGALVNPKFQNSGAALVMAKYLMAKANDMKLSGVYGQATAAHAYSQKIIVKHFNFTDCAVLIGDLNYFQYKGIAETSHEKFSAVLMFKPIMPRSKTVLYLPESHCGMLEKTYEKLGLEITSKNPPNDHLDSNQIATQLRITTNMEFNKARIYVDRLGHDAVSAIKRTLKLLCMDRIEAIYLFLDLSDPLSATIVPECENMDFFYSGLFPYYINGHDAFILQYRNNLKIDYDQIKIYSPWGQEILKYILDRDPNRI